MRTYFGRNLLMLIEYPTEVVDEPPQRGERAQHDRRLPFAILVGACVSARPCGEAAYFGINRANTVISRVPAIPMDTVAPRPDRGRGEVPSRDALLLPRRPVRRRSAQAHGDDIDRRRQRGARDGGRDVDADREGPHRCCGGVADELAGDRFRSRDQRRRADAARQSVPAGCGDGHR